MTRILAIDPGLTGAYALFDADGCARCDDLPVIRDGALAWIDGAAFASLLIEFKAARHLTAIVERQGAQPIQGVSSAFRMGTAFGSVLAALQIVGARVEFVTPAVWKRHHGLNRDKHASLHKARLLFPDLALERERDHNRAEALLIGTWWLSHGT